ncbi:hypothetical protein EDC04DRAFT_2613076 [Pisolithus marmoratus]|nr:hypothetical protein EDC04DRAFT_2613076 [Pisolithus marmoratus]
MTSHHTTALLLIPLVSLASVSNWGEQVDLHLQSASECAPDHLHVIPTDIQPRETAEDTVLLAYHLRLVNHALIFIDLLTFQPTLLSLTPGIYSNVTRDFLCPTPFDTVQCETRVLDIFIVIETREDLFTDTFELHLGRCTLFKDLFDLMQPRSHIENLVRHDGMGKGLVHITSTSAISSSATASLDSMASGSRRSQNRTSITFTVISVATSNNPPCPDLGADI